MSKLESTAQTVSTVVGVVILSALVGVGGTLAYQNRSWFDDNVRQFWRPDQWVQKNDLNIRMEKTPWTSGYPMDFPKFTPNPVYTRPMINPQQFGTPYRMR